MTAMKSSATTMPSSLFAVGLLGMSACSMIVMGLMGLLGLIGLMGLIGFFVLVPEEVLSLGFLLAGCLGAEDGLERVGVVTSVPHLGGNGQRGWCEVLYLFQMETKAAGDGGELCHILFVASGMA